MGLGWGLSVGISNQVMAMSFCGIAKGGVFFGGGKEKVVFTALLNYKFEFSN